jgi:hypothetical protein
MAHKIFGRYRLFHPGQIEIPQPTDALDRAGSALRLIEVEHQPHTVADRPPHLGDEGHVAFDVSAEAVLRTGRHAAARIHRHVLCD